MVFIETEIFTKRIQEILTDEEYSLLQADLIKRPDAGPLIPGGRTVESSRAVCEGGCFMKGHEFKEILKSIDQAREIRQGKRSPSRAFHYEPVRVKAVRTKLGLTQSQFAELLCVSLGTLQNWEQGRTYPEGAAIALLRVAESKPDAVLEALHAV